MQGPFYKVHVSKGPRSDLIDHGRHGKVLPKTSQGPFFKKKKGHFCFPAGSGPKKALSLSLDVKCDQQTHKKRCLQSQENHPTSSHNNFSDVTCWETNP
jgi:hypothetical protein